MVLLSPLSPIEAENFSLYFNATVTMERSIYQEDITYDFQPQFLAFGSCTCLLSFMKQACSSQLSVFYPLSIESASGIHFRLRNRIPIKSARKSELTALWYFRAAQLTTNTHARNGNDTGFCDPSLLPHVFGDSS